MVDQLKTLGKYHVLERLAAAPLAEVYKVKTVGIAGFEKIQVLKRVMPRYSQDPTFVRAFIEEAKIAFSLNHRNIVQVFEFGKIDDDLFLASEYIPGVNLRQVLRRIRAQERATPVGLSCYLMGEVAAGLEYAHHKTDQSGEPLGVMHSHLTPSNVACSFEGSVKILDFGIARAACNTVPLHDRLRGLPRWLAPEQLRNEPVTPLSDIFSFGTILWELLTGMPLFEGDSLDAVAHNLVHAPIPRPRSLNREVPEGLDEATMRCLERRPERRFASANDLQLELHRIQREVGAVIGSRALSTFLQELVPDFRDTRDVRQEDPQDDEVVVTRRRTERRDADDESDRELTVERVTTGRQPGPVSPAVPRQPPPPGTSASRSDSRAPVAPEARDLIAAAAELALPHNPPARPVTEDRELPLRPESQDHRWRRAGRNQPLIDDGWPSSRQSDRASATDTDERPPLRRAPSVEARIAGLLRPVLDPEDEVSAGPPPRFPRPDRGLSLVSDRSAPSADDISDSGELFDDPPHHEGGRRTVSDASNAGASTEAASPSLDGAPSTETIPERSAPQVELSDLSAAEALSIELPAPRDELDEPEDSIREVAPGPAALGERKRFIAVSVLLAEPRGAPGDELRGEAQQLVANIAYKLGGLLHEQADDELLFLFGLPTRNENDIVSAVRFAFDALDAAAHLHGTIGSCRGDATASRPAIHFGIRAGTARLGGHPSAEGYQVLGNSLQEARALARHAPDGQILIAGAAARLAAAHYVLREVDPVARHGKLIRCHRVMALRTGARDRQRGRTAPLIGREVETRAMRSIWRDAIARGQQRTVLVVGEAGIGKTRLVDDFILEHCSSDARVIAAAASPHRIQTPFALIANLLRSVTGVWGGRGSRSRTRLLGRLESILQDHPASEADVDGSLDAFASVLEPSEAPVSAAGGGFARNALYHAVRRLLHRAAGCGPLVLQVDDLHWADSSSVECLRALVERGHEAASPLLLLFTIRPDEGGGIVDAFDDRAVSRIHLEELNESQRQRLIVDLLGERADDDLVADLERRTGGSPFLIRELCHAIKEGAEAAEIPSTVEGLITARIDRLQADVKAVLQHATVIGPTFREGILTTLLARNPARPLAELRNRGILTPSTDVAVPFTTCSTGVSDQFERQWSFRHVLVQETVYSSLHGSDRRKLHRRVGEIMLRRANRGSSDPPAEIARHLELGGLGRQAGEFYLRAANAAAAAYANKAAAEIYDRALRLTENDADLQYAAFAGRERVFGRLGLHDKQAADLLALRRLCGVDPQRLADLRTREAVRLLRLGELFRALEAAEQAEKAALEADDELLHAEALRLRGEAYGRLNDHARAISTVTRALEVFDRRKSAPHQVRARIALGRIHLLQADYDGAFQHYDPALELIRKTGDRWQERILRNNLAVVHACRGDFSRALKEARCSLELCQQFGDRAREGDNTSVLGIVYLELGMYDQARAHIERALALHRETGSLWSEADCLVYAGLLETAMRRFQRALELLGTAKQLATRMGAKYIAVNARNATALALCDRNQPGDAARAVDEASEAFEMAQSAGLVVGEIPGLSRAARGTALLGNLEAARALSRRAVELLSAQKNIESAEEEILYTHFRILDRMSDPGALEHLEQAHSTFVAKMALIEDPDARQSLSENVRLFVALRRDYRASQQRRTIES